MALIGNIEYYKGIGDIKFEGSDSNNPFAFKYYDPEKIVAGKALKDHFRFAVAYWHSFCGQGTDPFGSGTQDFLWDKSEDPYQAAKDKADAAFEFITKMGFDYFCFHDFDLIQEGKSIVESENRLLYITDYIKQKQKESGVKVLWGTANCFSNPHYMNGAATNPEFDVLARAGGQVKLALDTTIALNGENYVFWGGREGYMSLLNTDMKRELDHLGKFLSISRDYARSQGFKGNFFIEPKPMEPTKHQYDFDTSTAIGFLKEYGLENDFKINIEVNHATLAQHTFQHELTVAAKSNMLGSIDANRGDYQNGWDTDQFPNNLYETTEAMLVFLKAGGLQGGGVNFDAKIRRNSTDLDDIFYAHIGGADNFARALITADNILNNSNYNELFNLRYESFSSGKGKEFEQGKLSLNDLYKLALNSGELKLKSGKQEMFENIINQFI
ncbi:xylose isomerase [Flavobacteriaceae bacterium]|nr:xylose isomerase [Flavobacteriaceae bacterium]MDB4024840.1 xylose isomerase [Flavobacteriaceae bacterium]MDB4131190.1 xylose isomerase [Flavobacteriaceae bacterium]MDB9827817.1 xylose isomerase [Flavobacteriaceae bacterium]MDC1417124.1 xylose isomerase [Flavobacteriaceae bacterium]